MMHARQNELRVLTALSLGRDPQGPIITAHCISHNLINTLTRTECGTASNPAPVRPAGRRGASCFAQRAIQCFQCFACSPEGSYCAGPPAARRYGTGNATDRALPAAR